MRVETQRINIPKFDNNDQVILCELWDMLHNVQCEAEACASCPFEILCLLAEKTDSPADFISGIVEEFNE